MPFYHNRILHYCLVFVWRLSSYDRLSWEWVPATRLRVTVAYRRILIDYVYCFDGTWKLSGLPPLSWFTTDEICDKRTTVISAELHAGDGRHGTQNREQVFRNFGKFHKEYTSLPSFVNSPHT